MLNHSWWGSTFTTETLKGISVHANGFILIVCRTNRLRVDWTRNDIENDDRKMDSGLICSNVLYLDLFCSFFLAFECIISIIEWSISFDALMLWYELIINSGTILFGFVKRRSCYFFREHLQLDIFFVTIMVIWTRMYARTRIRAKSKNEIDHSYELYENVQL